MLHYLVFKLSEADESALRFIEDMPNLENASRSMEHCFYSSVRLILCFKGSCS
jgi:hypothetical protein